MKLKNLWNKFNDNFEQSNLKKGAYRAPGRVNLIGEHTDYNDGFVLPMAIEKEIIMLGQLRNDRKIKAYSLDYDKMLEIRLDNFKYDEENIWLNYIMGVITEIQKKFSNLQGFNLMFTGNIPQGAGLSSSAALEIAAALTITDLNELKISGVEMALLAQRAENNFVGVQCGIMDQYISRLGQKNKALLIDCRTNDYQLVPFKNNNYQIVICNSKVERGLVDSEYNKRRSECKQAVDFFAEKVDENIKALRDLDLKTLNNYKNQLQEKIYKRAHHVISENQRVLASKKALKNNDMPKFGRLMYESHQSLSNEYEVSSRELDILTATAKKFGVEGARMTGAGFGGCTVNLVKKEKITNFIKMIKAEYKNKTGIEAEIYISNPGNGAEKLKN